MVLQSAYCQYRDSLDLFPPIINDTDLNCRDSQYQDFQVSWNSIETLENLYELSQCFVPEGYFFDAFDYIDSTVSVFQGAEKV